MITHLKGILTEIGHTNLVIECNGVGYQLLVSLKTIEQLPEIGNEIKLLSHFIPREDSHTLYGFAESIERDMFRLLISISGIGPKIALGILSSVSINDLVHMISISDIKSMTKLPGIGKKTAERLLVELKDKIQDFGDIEQTLQPISHSGLANEAISALIALGYNKSTSEKCVNKVLKDTQGMDLSAEIIIRNALKYAMS